MKVFLSCQGTRVVHPIMLRVGALLPFLLAAECAPPQWSSFRNGPQHTGRSAFGVVNSTTAAINWTFPSTDWMYSSVAIGDTGMVFACSFDHYIYALDGDTGALVWKYETPDVMESSPAISPDSTTLYVGCHGEIKRALPPPRLPIPAKASARSLARTQTTSYMRSTQRRVALIGNLRRAGMFIPLLP